MQGLQFIWNFHKFTLVPYPALRQPQWMMSTLDIQQVSIYLLVLVFSVLFLLSLNRTKGPFWTWKIWVLPDKYFLQSAMVHPKQLFKFNSNTLSQFLPNRLGSAPFTITRDNTTSCSSFNSHSQPLSSWDGLIQVRIRGDVHCRQFLPGQAFWKFHSDI